MVPTFTCGLLRSNFSLAMSTIPLSTFYVRSTSGADVQDRTGDLVLTKDALCQLSYIGSVNSHSPSGVWSGRRGSNPRPTAWKAVTLPLSYSRKSQSVNPSSRLYRNGGEGRTRTFEAARATDLQSAAFDRFATSPIVCNECCVERPRRMARIDGAGEGTRTPDLLITNQLLYRPELRQPDKRGTLARSVPEAQPWYRSTRCPLFSTAGPGPV